MMILYYIQIILLISGLKLIKLYSMSPCLSGPCIHGVCVDVEENLYYKCYCINGYTGLNCQTNYDDCRSMPCQHGATCIDGIASFTCSCAEGYTGQLCEDNINECLSNPCQNEGICHDLVNGYKCECLSGYKGEHCEDDINMCNITSSTVTPCLNGGTCIDGPGDKYTCSCPVGFVGARCENDVDECKSSPCKNNGVCIDKPSKFSCICPFGWTGKFCETEVRECEENYCENEAICLVKIFTDGINITDPTCYCVPDYHGLFCEHRYNECLPMTPCMNGGVCVDGIDSFTCTCLRGYTGAICETSCTSEICDLSTQRYTLSMLYDTTQMISTVPTLTIMPETSSYGSFTYVSFQPSDVLTFITDIVASFISSPSLSLDSPSFITFSESIVWTPFQTIFDISSLYMPVSKSEATDTVLITGHSFSDIQTYSLQTGTHFATSSVLVSSSMESSIQHGSDFEDGTTSVTTSRFTEYTETEVSEISTLETVLYSSILDIPLPTIASYSLYPSTDFFSSFLSDVSFDTSSMHAVITLSDIEAIESTQVTIDTDFPIVTLPTSLDSILQPTPTISFSDESHMFSSETVLPDISKLDMTSFSIETCYGCTDVLTPSYDSIATSDICDNCFTSYVPSYPSSVIDDLHTFSFTYTSLLTETASDISDVAPSAIDSSVIEITTPTPTAVQNLTGLPPLCEDLECENGGIPTRSFDSNETICECLCPLHTMGLRCEEETTVNVPQFLGKSFLKYSLPETIPQYGLNIDFTFRTVLPKGLLFYTELSEEKIFLLLYIHNGMLKLNFSCGQQIMVFSESSLRVDFGFYTAVSLNLWITKDVKNGSCTAALHVNDSAAMSGQQLLMYPKIHFKHLYLGGLPINYVASQSNAHMIEFFVGCIKNLQVNEEEMKMINDALTGAAIIECDSGMCAFQPCWNEGKCISNGENWYCVCKTGYTGVLCEHMNCDANPCEHGGTCLPITNIKYICLCPFEYHSINCEKSLTISRPSFHGDVLEYSSFIQYSNKIDIQHHLYIKLKFTTSDFLQYGLLVFTGQQDVKDPMADYLALTLEKGFITYYINLGSGYRWIQSPTSLNISLLVHTVYFGHHKRYIWLVVDNQKKVTGVTPGKLTALNTVPHIFVGGHVSYNFTLLPFPIAQLTGFKGCIFDIEISNSPQNSFLTLNNIVSGRNVQQCNKTECELTLCENGGTCVDFGTTFECLCNAGWAGPTCSLKITPCSVGTHHCAPKSTCMVLTDGYRCDCALGHSGIYCNETSIPSDPQFNGRNSFMEFKQQNIRRKTDIKIQLKPKSDNGLLFYATQQMNENTGDFIALTIVNGYVNLRYNLGTGLGTTTILQNPQRVTINKKILTINGMTTKRYKACSGDLNSTTAITPEVMFGSNTRTCRTSLITLCHHTIYDKWHTVVVKRYEQVAYLIVDNNEVSVKSPPVMIALDTTSNFFVGGLPDLTVISKEAVEKVPTTYSGCISYFEVNNKKYVLSAEAIHGRNIDGCDGASCGLHSCKNGGTCIDFSNGTFSCNCLPGYLGLQCDISSLCFNHQCQNGGTCIPTTTSVIYSCDCPVGWTGLTCEKALNVSVAKFGENSYIYFWDKHYQFGDLSETNLAFNFSSINESGLLLWSGKDSRNDDYLGIGLQNGQLKIVWNLGWLFHHRILTEENYFGDSNWHSFSFKRYKQEVIVAIDDKKYTSKSTGDYYELNTNGQYYFGGFPRFMKTKEITNGHFTVPLNGCIGNIVLPYTWDFTDIMNANSSANIENCESNYVSL